MTVKPETVSHVAEQFSRFPSTSCPLHQQLFPIKSLAWTALLSSDNSFPSVRQEPTLKPWKGSPFLDQNHSPGENIFKILSCREGNGTPSSIFASEILGAWWATVQHQGIFEGRKQSQKSWSAHQRPQSFLWHSQNYGWRLPAPRPLDSGLSHQIHVWKTRI